MASVTKRPNGTYLARYRKPGEVREYTKTFPAGKKRDAEAWLADQVSAYNRGTWSDPSIAKMTTGEWLDRWLEGYSGRTRTVNSARTHLQIIREEFGNRQIRTIRPADVKTWLVKLQATYAPSYVYALHRRLSQICADAIHNGVLHQNPCSRRTSPPAAKQRAYVATTEQVWALHDALPAHFRPVVLLGAFAGLRVGEIAALRVEDVDFMRGVIHPTIQYPNDPLKTDVSRTAIPIPQDLAVMLNANPVEWGSSTIVVGAFGRAVAPYTIEEAWRTAREKVEGLPPTFRIHDLRHYFASMLIAAGLDIKTVQARLRHSSAKTTLDTYGHLWPDRDETSRVAVSAVLGARKEPARTGT